PRDARGGFFSTFMWVKPGPLRLDVARREYGGFLVVMEALGLDLITPQESAQSDVPAEIVELAKARWNAKQDKDWGEADRLRDEIAVAGWEIKDAKDGYEICPKS
ncbi:MAG: cysteine--tRNA ligase, partial [Verrucomicrobiota bacterium]